MLGLRKVTIYHKKSDMLDYNRGLHLQQMLALDSDNWLDKSAARTDGLGVI